MAVNKLTNPYQTYRETQVMTATPQRLVGMMYEGAIRSMCEARQQAENDDWAAFRERLFKAICIVDELILSLDGEQGGEVAANLSTLYAYVKGAMAEGCAYSRWEPVEPALQVLDGLRETWDELCRTAT